MEIIAAVYRHVRADVPLDTVYTLLADVPRSIAHFPDVDSVRETNGVWQWRLRELGAGPVRFQVTYSNRYHTDPDARRVWWERVPSFGNTQVDGRWILSPDGAGTRITMDARFVIATGFPRLLRPAVEAVVAHENERLIGAYMQNLVKTLHGGDGRRR
jgi:hypothetical protein